MLSAKELIESREKPAADIPTFGVKDFEPDGSLEQSCQIQNSLLEIKNIISHERVKLLNTLSQAIWLPHLQLAEVTHQTGPHWSYMGHTVGQKLYIYPEEALYLLETGSIQIMFNEVPLSVQRAYFVLFNPESNVTIEKYNVYSLLSSHGYKVVRHAPQNTVTKYEKQLEVHKLGIKLKDYHSSTGVEKRQQDTDLKERSKKLKVEDTIKFPIECDESDDIHDINDILKKAQIIQPYEYNSETNLEFDYDVYVDAVDKPFKKSCLQLPNFRVIIHRGEDSTPDVAELSKLSKKYKDEVPVIHAIVFLDNVSFYKIDAVVLPDAFD